MLFYSFSFLSQLEKGTHIVQSLAGKETVVEMIKGEREWGWEDSFPAFLHGHVTEEPANLPVDQGSASSPRRVRASRARRSEYFE